jgi:hypothetical protein
VQTGEQRPGRRQQQHLRPPPRRHCLLPLHLSPPG